ncbi:MAG TPA: VCBS repeat-containing protein [Chitinophagaceae bacterium]|nr:VCBS repeat-containing protein [Chitinophagaceae bacterium]
MNKTMKLIPFLFVLSLLTKNIFANRIDSLKTDNDVSEFLKSINEDFRSEKYNKIELRSTETLRQDLNCDGVADRLQVNNWEKADFNGDGRTDLLILLYWYDYGVYVVMDNGDGTYKLLTLSYNIFEKCELAKPVKKDDQQLLLFYEKKTNSRQNAESK